MYRAYFYNGAATDRVDFTEGEFTTPAEVSIAEVAAALGVPEQAITASVHEQPPVAAVVIPAPPPSLAPAPPLSLTQEEIAALKEIVAERLA
jgi:hypothetical protein